MKELKKYFDDYTIKARILPGLTVIAPFIIVAGFLNAEIDITINVIFVIGLLTFMSVICRNLGVRKEKKIVKKLGAYQTTLLLRYSDSTIDSFTKTRYHSYLNEQIKNLDLPLLAEDEVKNPHQSDDMYNSAIRWLRKNRRDKEKFPFVHKDLTTYGFTRNLLGLKLPALILYIGVLLSAFIYLYANGEIEKLYQNTDYLISSLTIVISIVILLFGISFKTVVSQGFAYAKTILETCE
ncbi:MAG: hypothetical protein CNC91_04725 [Flavobacteriales bacterium MED-G22]|nr:MAG: hypothetical protein CNC91_04725 [Flavobacteriales bacterium MED-G22]|tara:strand:+ start:109 stop:822 length:714 start_codon:yes stop_codon:yes gene_type:complete